MNNDELALVESKKYEKMYSHERYKSHPAAVTYAERFLKKFSWHAGQRIVDFGCGPGFASNCFREKGLEVLGIDIAYNTLKDEYKGRFPVLIATLWNLPVTVKADFGFCCDVMEHIPPQHVDGILQTIRDAIDGPCFFNISFRPDGYGQLIGETLHMSIHPASWWESKLRTYWSNIEFMGGQDDDYGTYLVSEKPIKAT